MVVEAAGVAACAAAGALAYAVRGRSSRFFGPSVWRGPRDRNAVALTFDDGPSEGTPELLDILGRYSVPATFFLCGVNVRRLPAFARAVAAAGHEIGNHSDTHLSFCFRPARWIREEVVRAQETIREVTGVSPVWFRAPFGARWFGLRAVLEELGLTGVMWTVIARDWNRPGGRVASALLRGAGNGAILCLHDGRQARERPDVRPTIDAVRLAVPALLDRGFRFDTIGNLTCPTN